MINIFSDRFEVKAEFSDSLYQVQLREISNPESIMLPLYISLTIPLDRNSYTFECFEVKIGSKNEEELSRLHSVKVEGTWNLKRLEEDLSKIIRGEFKTYKPRYHPF